MNHQNTFDHIHDIAECIESISDLLYKMMIEFHSQLDQKTCFYNIEEAMGQVLTLKLLSQDLEHSLPVPDGILN